MWYSILYNLNPFQASNSYKLLLPSRQIAIESQKNNVSGRCSMLFCWLLNRFFPLRDNYVAILFQIIDREMDSHAFQAKIKQTENSGPWFKNESISIE